MAPIFLLLALSPGFASATPLKDLAMLKADPALHDAWPSWKQADTGVLEVEMVNRDRGTGREVLRMQNTVRLKRLPSAKAEVHRQELRFLAYSMKVQPLAEAMAPVHLDLTPRLKGIRLVLSSKANEIIGIEGLEKARAEALKHAEPQERRFLEQLLHSEQLRKQMARRNESGCFQDAPGKKVGAKWKAKQAAGNGAELEIECHFVGWGKLKGKKFLLLRGALSSSEKSPEGHSTRGTIDSIADPKGEEILVLSRVQVEMDKSAMDLNLTAHFHPW